MQNALWRRGSEISFLHEVVPRKKKPGMNNKSNVRHDVGPWFGSPNMFVSFLNGVPPWRFGGTTMENMHTQKILEGYHRSAAQLPVEVERFLHLLWPVC